MANDTRQWDAVFLRVLDEAAEITGEVIDRAIATANQAAPRHAAEMARWTAANSAAAAVGRRRQRSKPWIGRMHAARKTRR